MLGPRPRRARDPSAAAPAPAGPGADSGGQVLTGGPQNLKRGLAAGARPSSPAAVYLPNERILTGLACPPRARENPAVYHSSWDLLDSTTSS